MKTLLLLAVLLPNGVHLIPGSFTPGTQPDGNSVVFDAPAGLIVVDTGRHPEHTQKIVDFANAAHRPVRAIVNTHWHLDHIGGNARLKEAFPAARVYASNALEDALHGFLANYRAQLEDALAKGDNAAYRAEVALIDSGAKLGPDEIVTQSGRRTIAGRKLVLNVDRNAVTAADVWVFDPQTGTVAAGDLVTLPAPFLDTACPAGWSAELARIDRTSFRVLIPGHGEPMTHDGFANYRGAFDALLACHEAKDACINAWIGATRSLAPDADGTFTRSLMSDYVDLLRSGRLKCPSDAARP
ncbi:MAG TPA: MBL fold metallo-hydrolase [Thermoanaerobaculia bacterium]|nr:MBL fold metallo-hydrolase [Thermoanaerobaculia bacterium]